MYVFYFVRYHSGWMPDAKVGPWGTNNTLSSTPTLSGVTRGTLETACGVVRRWRDSGPLLFLPGWSGGLLRHQIQGDLGPGSLVLWQGAESCRVRTSSILPILRRSGLRSCLRWLSCLLSQRRVRVTGSSRRADAFREEVSHRLR